MNILLKVFAEAMKELEINYDFMEWKTTPVPYPYFVGQYFVDNFVAENNQTEGQLLLVGWDRNESFINLIDIEIELKRYFSDYRYSENGTSVSINYVGSNSEHYDGDELKKIEMRFDFYLWEGVN